MTVQPTEQCVQIFLRMVTAAPGVGGGPAFGLAHARERQRAQRRQTAGNKAGTAKESAAVETAAGLFGERGGKLTVAGLAFCSFDQHRCLPYFVGYRFTR